MTILVSSEHMSIPGAKPFLSLQKILSPDLERIGIHFEKRPVIVNFRFQLHRGIAVIHLWFPIKK